MNSFITTLSVTRIEAQQWRFAHARRMAACLKRCAGDKARAEEMCERWERLRDAQRQPTDD